MNIRVGLTTDDLTSLGHKRIVVSICGTVFAYLRTGQSQEKLKDSAIAALKNGEQLIFTAKGNELVVSAAPNKLHLAPKAHQCIELKTSNHSAGITIENEKRLHKSTQGSGRLMNVMICAIDSNVHIALITSPDTYLKGVLQSEIPGSYKLEAIKAQAVAARTYALNPRINHLKDNCDVCDSYLCCQYFAGLNVSLSPVHERAIKETENEILVFEGKPILALFSSCAGGHTENYENCFSDPLTNAFPPKPLAYLKGVPEGNIAVPFDLGPQRALEALFKSNHPRTYDAWSSHFRWTVHLPADCLESQMHHVLDISLQDKDMAPFIVAPASDTFGHIHSFAITRRGVAGTAIVMEIKTSHGAWQVRKELVIRSVFRNNEIGFHRLKSARIFFEHHRDRLGLLSELVIHGLGWGHGVGLQQTGAQGMALQGKTYKQILAHYFGGAAIEAIT
jgi:SpoIID/LytB domain protein